MRDDRTLNSYLSVLGLDAGRDRADLRRGQFHDVVLAGDAAYRFPRDEESRRALPGRVALLNLLGGTGPELAGAVPVPLAEPDMGQPLGRCHAKLRRVPGRPLGRDEASSPEVLAEVLAELSRALDALAKLGGHPAVGAAVPGADPGYWERFASEVERVLFPLMTEPGRQRAAAEMAAVRAVDPVGDALVHGDLGGTNLLWTATASGFRLSGIIDWDEAHLGSQADDLASLAATFGWPLAEALDRRRHGGDCPTIADARVIEATFALQQALPAALIGDTESLEDGLTRYTK
jgi:aminoglycoside phosphotransferase (APT) family kinase protein